jgi:lipopolysaccharide export system protein LptA
MKPANLRLLLAILLPLAVTPAQALKSDRQKPLEVRADASDGTLGDGTATLRGNVEINQGTLLIRADVATVERAEGRVRRFELEGNPVHLLKVEYEVASGIVTLTGAADVEHPQYHISGEVLRYDMNAQHFQGSGGEADGRIQIRMEPEVLGEGALPGQAAPTASEAPAEDESEKPPGEQD